MTYKKKYKGGGILHLDAGGFAQFGAQPNIAGHVFGGWNPDEIDTESSNPLYGYGGGNRIVDIDWNPISSDAGMGQSAIDRTDRQTYPELGDYRDDSSPTKTTSVPFRGSSFWDGYSDSSTVFIDQASIPPKVWREIKQALGDESYMSNLSPSQRQELLNKYLKQRSEQQGRMDAFVNKALSPQATLSRQESYNQQAQQPDKDWTGFPHWKDYDLDQDGELNKSEKKKLKVARENWEKAQNSPEPTPPTSPLPYQGAGGAQDPTQPVKEPGEPHESFLKRFWDWISQRGRSPGGGKWGIGIPFPGGGNDGRGFPFPLPPWGGGGGGGGGGGTTTPPTPPTPPVQPPADPPPVEPPPVQPPPTEPPPGDPPPVEPPVQPPPDDGRVIPDDDDSENTTPIYINPWPSPSDGGSQPPGGPIVSNPKTKPGEIPPLPEIPKSLAQIDSRYADQQHFSPLGIKTPYEFTYEGLPGMQYGNYGGGERWGGGPLTTYNRPPPPGGSTGPGTGTTPGGPGGGDTGGPGPGGGDDTDSGNTMSDVYDRNNPKPKLSDFGSITGAAGIKNRTLYEAALEEWEENKRTTLEQWGRWADGGLGDLGIGGIGGLRFAENGGIANLEEFPRRSGQIAGPGTERSDDIPAMLSDGEFVVNAKAVRGVGDMMGASDGKEDQRREGARAMYALQKMGEKAAGMS